MNVMLPDAHVKLYLSLCSSPSFKLPSFPLHHFIQSSYLSYLHSTLEFFVCCLTGALCYSSVRLRCHHMSVSSLFSFPCLIYSEDKLNFHHLPSGTFLC